jgi:hypothetical protein
MTTAQHMESEMKLLDAVQQTILHLETNMGLEKHPKECACYGCNLKKAYFDHVFETAKENVRHIVELEVNAENATRALHL